MGVSLVPNQLHSGQKITFSVETKPGFELKVIFKQKLQSFNAVGIDADGVTTFTVIVPAIAAGKFLWQIIGTSEGFSTLVSSGSCVITQLLDQAGADTRTQNEIDLDNVQAAIRALVLGGAVKAYTIGTRSFTKMDIAELEAYEERLKIAIGRERRRKALKAGKADPFTLKVRF